MPLDSPIHNLRGIPRFNPAETFSKIAAASMRTVRVLVAVRSAVSVATVGGALALIGGVHTGGRVRMDGLASTVVVVLVQERNGPDH